MESYARLWYNNPHMANRKPRKRIYKGITPARRVWVEAHKDDLAAYQREYRQKHQSKLSAIKREYRQRIRLEGIEAYGGRCICCGESQPEFLTLDHINGRTEKDRHAGGGKVTGQQAWMRLKRDGWPKDNFQLMCFNCNCARAIYGECPHKVKSCVKK